MHIRDLNKCMGIDDWYMHYIWNIFEKFMHIEAWYKDEKKTCGHSQKRESEEDFNACMNGYIHYDMKYIWKTLCIKSESSK